MQSNSKIIFIVLIANLIAAIYGFVFYYGFQLMNALKKNIFLLIFIPDSPLAALLLFFSFIFVLFKFNSRIINFFKFFSFVFAQKIAIWTCIVLSVFYNYYATIQGNILTLILFFAHFLLFLECFLLIGKIRLSNKIIFLSFFLLVLSDLIDFYFQIQPPIPKESSFFIFLLSLSLTIVFSFISVIELKKLKPFVLANIFNFF
jgi:uncharacterized membrane protein YpjA